MVQKVASTIYILSDSLKKLIITILLIHQSNYIIPIHIQEESYLVKQIPHMYFIQVKWFAIVQAICDHLHIQEKNLQR